jgi:hypothetical protein
MNLYRREHTSQTLSLHSDILNPHMYCQIWVSITCSKYIKSYFILPEKELKRFSVSTPDGTTTANENRRVLISSTVWCGELLRHVREAYSRDTILEGVTK